MTIAYRAAEIEDAQFVVSQWSRCFKPSRSAGIIADDDWPRVMHPTIQKILARPDVRTIIAYENTDPTFLYGFIVSSTGPTKALAGAPIVYFTCVKESFRRAGYARGLFAAAEIDPNERFVFTCWTPVLPKLSDKIPLAKHDPGFARIVGYVEPEPRSADRWRR